MFRFVLMAGIMLVAGVVAVRFVDQAGHAPASVMAAKAAPEPVNSRTMVIKAGDGGHFAVEARVDGRRIDFMVDTGASHIALRESDAARLGIHPTPRDYNDPHEHRQRRGPRRARRAAHGRGRQHRRARPARRWSFPTRRST